MARPLLAVFLLLFCLGGDGRRLLSIGDASSRWVLGGDGGLGDDGGALRRRPARDVVAPRKRRGTASSVTRPSGSRAWAAALVAWLGAGHVAQAQVAQDSMEHISTIFRDLDMDGDGYVDRDEFVKGSYRRVTGRGVLPDDYNHGSAMETFLAIFDNADGDNDGRLTWEEAEVFDDMAKKAMFSATQTVINQLDAVHDFKDSPTAHAELAASLVATFTQNVPSGGMPLEKLVRTAATVRVQHSEEDDTYRPLPPSLMDWLELLFRLCDINNDGMIDSEDTEYVVFMSFQILDQVLHFRTPDVPEGWEEWGDAMDYFEEAHGGDDAWGAEPDAEAWEDTPSAAAGMIEEMDEDHDGKISKAELSRAALLADPSGHALAKARELFDKFDANGDELLDLDEVARLVDEEGV